MREDQILLDKRAKFALSSGAKAAGARLRARFRWSNWLGWQQWLVLFAMGALVIGVEARNHAVMWRDHESGQTFWTDHMLVGEVILFGLVLPILAGISFEYMGRTAIERDKIARELALRRELVGQIHEAQGWHELAELIVRTPDSVVSADRAWLMAKRSDEEEFDHLACWERIAHGVTPSAPPVSPAVCERCVKAPSPKGSRILVCDHANSSGAAVHCTRYCLWLSSDGSRKAALLFDVPLDRPLDAGKMSVLDDLADEMSLAINNANLQSVQRRQIDVAKRERLRIARDLHDTLGQNLSVLRLKLEHLSSARLASGHSEFHHELAGMLAVADEAYEQVRDTLEELRMTEDRDLEEALRLYATQAGERSGFSVSVRTIGSAETLSPRQSRQVMYIAREALNNIEKHAGAQNVDIHLQWGSSEFRLTVRDDGKGFHPEERNAEDQYGMTIMGERSRALNADLVVESTPGKGAEVTLSLPLSSSVVAAS